jgi:dCMP deaminase
MRKSWDQYFIDIAKQVATRATCPRGSVGAIFVREQNILATGYNGSISRAPHCNELTEEEHVVNGHCDNVIHAELNAIAQAAKNGIRLMNSTLYCTHRPCWPCTKVLLNTGVIRIAYDLDYRPDEKVLVACTRARVSLEQIRS